MDHKHFKKWHYGCFFFFFHILRNIIYELLKKIQVVADRPVWQRSSVHLQAGLGPAHRDEGALPTVSQVPPSQVHAQAHENCA